jgi:hypothetical protein
MGIENVEDINALRALITDLEHREIALRGYL